MTATLPVVDAGTYQRDGLIVPGSRLADETMAEIRAELAEYLPADPSRTPDFVPDLMTSGFGLRWGRRPELLDVVTQLIGPDVALWACGLFGKPARAGKATLWHQDGQYWPIRPLATCTVWLALDHSTPSNGCLRYVPGSHRARELYEHGRKDDGSATLNQEITLTAEEAASVRDVVLAPGEFSAHDVYLVHGSAPNTSGARRAGVTFRYLPTTSHYDRDLARRQHRELGVPDISQRVLHLVSGTDRSGRNDVVVTQPAEPRRASHAG
jgi:ectoine hydroxylase-related dioxygenase (phytanoyl-CoA dioxygenase family)